FIRQEIQRIYQEQRQVEFNDGEAHRFNDGRRQERPIPNRYGTGSRDNQQASKPVDDSRIIIEARRIGLTPAELDELTPKEFKAVQRGYQLQLVDQRQQILFSKQTPQVSYMSGIEQNDLQKLFQDLYKRNTEESKRLVGVNE